MQSFPSYRFDGDKNAAAALRLTAQNLLHQARLIDGVSASRITKLNRSTPAGEVEVLIIEGQEYVNIFGVGGAEPKQKRQVALQLVPLSGILRFEGRFDPENPQSPQLHYKPTDDCFTRVLGSPDSLDAGSFQPIGTPDASQNAPQKLFVRSVNFSGYFGCRFSGLLSKMVDIVSGFEIIDVPEGVDVKPVAGEFLLNGLQSGYENCNGLVKPGDTPWLVLVSKKYGLLAKKLPLIEIELLHTVGIETEPILEVPECDVIAECTRLFGGIPSGEGFPVSESAINDGLADGTILRLIEPEAFAPYFFNLPDVPLPNAAGEEFMFALPGSYGKGWSFNTRGTEAHNTCVLSQYTIPIAYPAGQILNTTNIDKGDPSLDVAVHMKISFTESGGVLSAQLSEFSRERLATAGVRRFAPFFSYSEGRTNRATEFGSYGFLAPGETATATVHVLHLGDQLVRVRVQATANPQNGGSFDPEQFFIFDGVGVSVPNEVHKRTAKKILPPEPSGEQQDHPNDTLTERHTMSVWWPSESRDALYLEGTFELEFFTSEQLRPPASPLGIRVSPRMTELITPGGSAVYSQQVNPAFGVGDDDNHVLQPYNPVPREYLNNGRFIRNINLFHSTVGPRSHLIRSVTSYALVRFTTGEFPYEVELLVEGVQADGPLLQDEPVTLVVSHAFVGYI